MNIDCQDKYDSAGLAGALKLFLQDKEQLKGSQLSPEIAEILKNEYDKNGLEGVDRLSDAVNTCLMAEGCHFGFGSGCGLIEAEQVKRLYLFFVNLDTEQVLARRFIDLN